MKKPTQKVIDWLYKVGLIDTRRKNDFHFKVELFYFMKLL